MVGLRRMSSRSCWRCRSWMAARATAVAWAAGRLLRRAKPAGNRQGRFKAVAGAEGD